ncbi:ribonuclease H-like domain-containing protein, partial [Tanacetum coccineum]
INFFNIKHPKVPNDDERVVNDLNKGKSDNNSSSESGSNINTADFPVDSGNDADSSNDFVATLEKNVFSEEPISHWIDAMNQEMNALLRNGTWELVKLPEGRKAIGSKWIYKIKFRSSGEIDRYKARFVAQDFGQKEGIDYEETFSPVVKMVTIRRDKGVFLALLVYVDDIIITGNNVSKIEKFKVFLKSKFMIKDLEKLKYFLGIKVVDTNKGLGVHITKTSGIFLTAYSDADWAKCIVTRKSITGYCVFLNNSFVSWKSKKQNTLSKSSTKAEYELLLHNSAIKIVANPVFHERTKHLEIDLHFVREKVLNGVVKTVKVDSANQIADILTKGLDTVQHLKLVKKL